MQELNHPSPGGWITLITRHSQAFPLPLFAPSPFLFIWPLLGSALSPPLPPSSLPSFLVPTRQSELDEVPCVMCDHPRGWDNMAICSQCEACSLVMSLGVAFAVISCLCFSFVVKHAKA